ncbi:MAG: L-fucose:H+ symporter permease [Cyclobacteriaceae bacterium]
MQLLTKKNLVPFILVTTMFFMWGLANNMTDTLLAAFKRIMSMTDFQTSWIQVAFYGSYFCLAIPAALLIRRFQYKAGILVGLGMFIAGALLFYPASQTMVYGHFLAALFILAGGLSVLETTANPYILVMGDEATAIRRLNLAQSFNPIGSISGVVLSKLFILSQLNKATEAERSTMSASELATIQQAELAAVMGPYVGVAILLLLIWIVIYMKKMPKGSDSEETPPFWQSVKRLTSNKHYLAGVLALFCNVGAQIGIWSFTIRYVMLELDMDESGASNYYLLGLVLFMVGRFIFTGLMAKFSAHKLLGYSAVVAIACLFVAILFNGIVGVIGLVMISGCMSLMFPTIFGLASEGTGSDHKLAGSGLIMAILGGAVLPPIQGQLSDSFDSIKLSFIVPMLAFAIVAWYAFSQHRVAVRKLRGE